MLLPLLSAALSLVMSAAPGEHPALVVGPSDSPVRLDRAVVVTVSDAPPIVVYAATNTTGGALEQFMVIAFVFDARGTLKARQTAPGRRTLDPHSTKYSTLVLDGSPVAPDDRIVVGVSGAQPAGSEGWWRTDLQAAATAAAQPKAK